MIHPARNWLWLASALVLVLGPMDAPSQTAPPLQKPLSAEDILSRWAAAVGGGERLRGIENVYTRGTYDGDYGRGINEEWHTRQGQRIQRNVVESGERLHVFDGTHGWTRSRTGQVRPLSAREEASQADLAVVGSLAYLVPGRNSRLRFESAGEDPAGCCYLLRMISPTGSSSTWHIDRKTFLPVRQVGGPPLNFTVEFNGWEDVEGIKLPAQLILSASTGYRSTETLEAARFNERLPGGFFARPRDASQPSRFAAGSQSLNIPIVEENGHIFLQGRINGVGPVWLALDTGASSAAVDSARIKEFGIQPAGTVRASGAGGTIQAARASHIAFALPGVTLAEQPAGLIPLEFLSRRSGRPVAAILGYEFFSQFVVEIDFARQSLSLHDPKSFQYRGQGAVVPLELDGELPFIAAALHLPQDKEVRGKFVVDLGSEIPVMVDENYSKQHALLKTLGRTLELRGRGVGGDVRLLMTRIAGVEIQGTLVSSPIVAFPQNLPGSITAPGSVGNIGAALLRRFRVIFDYSRSQMILEKAANFDDAFETDMSGLALIAGGPNLETVTIARVLEASPAAEAGLQVGDQVLEVDKQPPPDLPTLRTWLRQDGRELELLVSRGGEKVSCKLKLRRLL